MVKGTSRRIIIVDSPDPRIFEKAIFLIRQDVKSNGVTGEDILTEARRAADTYLRRNVGKHARRKLNLPAPVYAAAGAAATAAAWIASMILK